MSKAIEITSELFDPFQPGKVRDMSIDQYESRVFYPVVGKDISNFKNNTIKIVTKGLNQHLHLASGYLDFVFQVTNTAEIYQIIAGVNDTLRVKDDASALVQATIPAGSYTLATLEAAMQAAISAVPVSQTGANFTLTSNPGGTINVNIAADANQIQLNAGLAKTLGFSSTSWNTVLTGVNHTRTGSFNPLVPIMHDNVLSLFRKASLWFNNVQVHSIDFPNFSSTIRNLQDLSQDYVDKHKEEWLYISNTHDNLSSNALDKRARTSGGKLVRCRVALRRIFPFLDTYDKVIRGVEIRVELEKNTANTSEILYVLANNGATASVLIKEMSMWIPEVVGSPAVEAKLLEDVIAKEKTVISYEDHQVYRQMNHPQSNITWVIDTISEVPLFIFVGMQYAPQLDQLQTDSAISLDVDPSTYQNLKLVRAECRINNNVYPKMPYYVNFDNNTGTSVDEYSRMYWEFLRTTYKESEFDNGSLLEYTNGFKNIYPFVTFNLSRAEEIQSNVTENNSIEVALQFSENPNNSIYLTAMVVYQSKIVLQTDGKSYEFIRV